MATITEDYVSFETAKLLKKKGFEGVVKAYYHIWDNGSNVCSVREFSRSEAPHLYIPAPTLQMAMKWLRKIHKLHIQILNPTVDEEAMEFNEEYVVGITNLSNYLFETPFDYVKFTSYEKAVETAIKYCLENLI